MQSRYLFVLAVMLFIATHNASAQITSSPSSRWVVLASSTDLDEAIGVASAYEWRFDDVRVVRSSNDWLAVIAGPISIPNGVKAAKQELLDQGGVPADLFLSNGTNFEATLWRPEEAEFQKWQASASNHVELELFGMHIFVDTIPADGGSQSPRLQAFQGGKRILSTVLTEVKTNNGTSKIKLIQLDPATETPEIVFSGYWGGAHCCTVSHIISSVDGEWRSIEAATLDGGGYSFRDLDGDGSMELLSADNSFLYAFSPYANSWPPLVIEQLRGEKIVDRRHAPSFSKFFRRELFKMEHNADRNSMWNSNSFLAAWVAIKALLGEFNEAWQKMIASYDRASNWEMHVCDRPARLPDCPDDLKLDASFPEALRQHLKVYGYLVDPRTK